MSGKVDIPMDLSSVASASTGKGNGNFRFFGKSSLEGEEDTDESSSQDSLWTQIQEHVFSFYHNMLEVHVYTPLMYAFLTILQLYQTLYFILSDLKIVDELNHKTLGHTKDFFKYLPVYPAVIESQIHVAYIFFFLFLFTMMLLYQGCVAFNFLFQTDELQNGMQQSQSFNLVKRQMSNSQKYLLKSASFYFILWKKLLITPSLYFSIDILFCNSHDGAETTKYHLGSGLECWSSVYIVFVIIGVLHLLLLAFSVWSVLQFLNDSFQDARIPWAQSTLKPMLISVLISFVYIIWEMASGDKNLKIIPDLFCLFASGLTLFFRIFQPTFQSKYVMRALIINEAVRFWFSIIKICHIIFQVDMSILEIMMASVISAFFCILTMKVLDARVQAVIIRGLDKIKTGAQLEIYLQAIYRMIDKDEKKTNVILQGILQNHIHTCIDRECPCYIYKYIDKSEQINENSYKIKQITKAHITQDKGWKYEKLTPGTRIQKQEMLKAENEFMDQFRLRKATDLEWQRRRKFYVSEDDSASEIEAKKTFTPAVWYEFIRYQLRGLVKKLKPTIQSHYTLSGFFFLKLKNEFQSLFELIQAQEKKPDLNQRFLIYRHKKRIERVIYSKHEKSSQMSRKLNILSVYEYEKNFSKFQKLITKNTYNCIKFWSELLEKDINVVKMHQLGIWISKNHQNITSIANKLLKIYPNQLIMLLNYSKYLNDVVNNEYNAFDYFQMALQQRINLKQKLKLLNNNDNEDLLFGENSFCSIFVLNTEGRKLGIIEYVNEEVLNLLGYSPQELIGKDINTIIPRMIARVHYNLLIKFFEKAESNVLNKVRELFAKDKEGYLIPIYLFSKVLPSLTNGLKLIGVIKKIQYLTFEPECPTDFNKVQQEYVICDAENNIQNFSYGLTVSFGIFPKMFQSANGNSLFDQDVNLEYLSSEFADKAEDLKTTGAVITLNTSRLFEKVDREILSNEEFNYFRERAQEVKVFCQMAEMSFSKLVSVKLYRLILFSKLQGDGIKNYDVSLSRESAEDDQNLSFNLASASVSSCSSTVMSMDRQLKDFKKQMTDNIEPKIVQYLRRIMQFVLFIIILLSALIFVFQDKSNQATQANLSNALLESQLLNKFIQTQNNLRTVLNIANNIEYYHKNMTLLPYTKYQTSTLSTDSRYNFLNLLNSNMIEEIRIIISKILKKYSDHDVVVYSIDGNGQKYSRKMDFSLALSQYIVNAIEIVNRNTTQLKMPAVNWTLNPNQTKSQQFTSLNAYLSSYYVINTGFKTLLRLIYDHAKETIIMLENYDENNLDLVIILSSVCAVIILSAQIVMIIVVQIVQNNKVRVLSLYSEIRIEDAVDSQFKCKKFYAYLTTSSSNFDNIQIRDFSNTQQFMSQLFGQAVEEDLNEQWEKFVERLYYLRVNNQKLNVEKLKRRLNDDFDMRKSIKDSQQVRHQYISNNSDFRETRKENEKEEQPQQKKKAQLMIPETKESDNRQGQSSYGGLSLNYYDPMNEDQKRDKGDNDSTMNKNQIILQNYKRFQQRQSRRFTIFESQRKMSVFNPQQLQQLPNLKDIKTNQPSKFQKPSKQIAIIEEEVKENEESNERLSDRQSSKNESDEESEEHEHSKRTKRGRKSLKDIEQSKDQESENRIGKHEQFSQIKSRNWRQILFVIIQTFALLAYFIFVMLYMARKKQDVDDSAKHLWASYSRTNEINQLFGYFRERLITGQNQIKDIENTCKNQFYLNENNIIDFQNSHGSMVNFLYDFIRQTDSVSFCQSIAPSNYNLTNCENFQKGLLNQGFKSSLFTFINYYTQQNITNANPDITTSMKVLNSEQIQSFLIASESYMVEMSQLLDQLWEQSIQNIFSGVKDIIQAVFIIFLVSFFISQVIITPKIINQLNETTWRSRGILNLVPNNIFKEMKQNSRIFKLLKT